MVRVVTPEGTPEERGWVTINEAAHILNVGHHTIRSAIDMGVLPAYRLFGKGQYRILLVDVDRAVTPVHPKGLTPREDTP